VGLLAGSRKSEAQANFPRQLGVAMRILDEFPESRFVIPTTPATEPVISKSLRTLPAKLAGREQNLIFEHGVDCFDEMVSQCDLCLTVSGTATLHVAGHGVPMIVVYRINPILWNLFGRWLVRTRTYSLVNLLSDFHEHIVPEFVPWYGTIDEVAEYALDLLKNPPKLDEQRQRLRHILQALDKPGASMNVARMALKMINGN
jgi:lipid-A-disaccharide synthase